MLSGLTQSLNVVFWKGKPFLIKLYLSLQRFYHIYLLRCFVSVGQCKNHSKLSKLANTWTVTIIQNSLFPSSLLSMEYVILDEEDAALSPLSVSHYVLWNVALTGPKPCNIYHPPMWCVTVIQQQTTTKCIVFIILSTSTNNDPLHIFII